jgi:antitoxin component YwqK of YwqJK toxin-antitoxin module
MHKTTLLIAFILLVCISRSSAQDGSGQVEVTKIYYDSLTQKKVKEIFHHVQIIKIIPDKKHHGEYLDTTYYVKSGPYTYYYENGNVQYTGFYSNEKKDSTWKYYDPKGVLLKTEKYRNGQLVK